MCLLVCTTSTAVAAQSWNQGSNIVSKVGCAHTFTGCKYAAQAIQEDWQGAAYDS